MSKKQSIRTTLVPLDGSDVAERAVPWAKAVATERTEIVLMEVTPVASSVRSIGGQVIGSAEVIQEGYRQIAGQQLDDAIARWFDPQDHIATRIVAGDPGEQILAVAAELNADLIVMSSHGRGAVGRFISGSVADRVMRHAPVPVMIVGPDGALAGEVKVERIVAPVEYSDLSLAALSVAAELARSAGAPVHVVHVIVPSADPVASYPATLGTLPPFNYELAQQRMEADAQDLIAKALAMLRTQGIEATSEIYSGNAADGVLAALRPGDVIVLSSHARQGLARWVIGSTSLKLIRSGQAPVVIVTRESIERRAE